MNATTVPTVALHYWLGSCPQFVTATGSFAPWSDATTPRTDKPVRFGYRWHVGDISGNGACWVRLNRSEMPTGWRMGYRV